MKSTALRLLAALLVSGTGLASAATVTLTDYNSIVQIDPTSSAGMFNWTVDGKQVMKKQWFWYRIGSSGPEQSLDTLAVPVVTPIGSRKVEITYSNATAACSVLVYYELLGGMPGSGDSDIGETIRIRNLGSSPLVFSFYQYSDYNLSPGGTADTVEIAAEPGAYAFAYQWASGVGLTEDIGSTNSATLGPNYWEVAPAYDTLAKLTDGDTDDLSGNSGPITGDVTWAFQWKLTLQPGGSYIISKLKGVRMTPHELPASIGDRVWLDANANGIQDDGEAGVANVRVDLMDCNNNLLASTNTDANGYYLFSGLAPGNYNIRVVPPVGYVLTSQDQGGDDAKDSDADPTTGLMICTTLTAGENDLTWDAGIYRLAQLGDRVWHDLNENGIQDSGEPGVPNVTVKLFRCEDDVTTATPLATTTTADGTGSDPVGYYQFTGLMPGCYKVQFVKPCEYLFTMKNVPSPATEATDSDADQTTGVSDNVTLASGDSNQDVDAGLICVKPSFTGLPGPLGPFQCLSEVPPPPVVTATDNCGHPVTVSFQETQSAPGASCQNLITRTWTATSPCGATANFTQTILVNDTIVPLITATGTTLTLGCNPSAAEIEAALGTATATDNCGAVTPTATTGTVVVNGCSRSQTRTWTATDACGNAATPVSRTVTWTEDTEAPVITATGTTLTLGCNPSAAEIEAALGTATATDNCGPVTPTATTGNVVVNGCSRSQTRTWAATDACGNAATPVSRTVTWTEDTEAPVITATGTTLTLGCNPSAAEIEAALGTATATDNCGPVTPTATTGNVVVNGCSRSQTRTWTATDACGNAATPVSRTVTWTEDTDAPLITATGTTLTLGCNPSAAEIEAALGTATATDNCGPVTPTATTGTVVVNGCSRSQTRTWTATDTCGNAATPVSRTVTWTEDTTPPVITCPPDVTVSNNIPTNLYCSFTPGGWGAPPSGQNPGSYLAAYFATVYPGGFVEVGIPGAAGFSMKFTSPAAIEAYLPAGGTPSTLTADAVNPTSSSAGVFGGQVLALKLNVDFSDAAAGTGQVGALGDLALNDATSPLHGLTVRQILGLANLALGGGDISGLGLGISQLNDLVTSLNEAFDNCVANDWAKAHLLPPAGGGNPPGGDPGTATATDNCDPHPTITYEDAVRQNDCGTVIVRTWKAVDACGNQATCVQTISQGCPTPTKASLGDFVWLDANQNGVQDAGEQGVAGVTVKLWNCAGVLLATTTTDALGYYRFSNLEAGTYMVQFVLPAGYQFSPADQGVDNSRDSDAHPATGYTPCITLAAGQNDLTWDAGLVASAPPCVPSTFKFDGSSSLDGPDGNVRVFSTNGISVKVTAFSRNKSNGTWAPAYLGQYSGGLGVTDNSEGNGGNNSHTVDNMDRDNFVLFEFSQPVVVNRAYLGYVVSDSDLTVWIGTFADPFNNHLNLDDTVLSSFTLSEDNLTSSSSTRWASFNAGEVTGNALVIAAWPGDSTPEDQFKISKLEICQPSAQTASLGDYVWEDTNRNGVQDEPAGSGINGVTVKLLSCTGAELATTVTANDAAGNPGYYLFSNLTPGCYQVWFVAPAGSQFTTPNTSGNPQTDSDADPTTGKTPAITLAAGVSDRSWDAGLFRSCVASLCGAVLRDCNADGIGEEGLPGATVSLKSGSQVIQSTTTGSDGSYCFQGLNAGTYTVLVTVPNHQQTADPDNCNDGKTTVTLSACQNKTGVNFSFTGTAPALSFSKTGPATARCGDTITYTYTVVNTGNTCLYGGVEVYDPMFGSGRIFHKTPVVPGEVITFTKSYVVQTTDLSPLVNTATAIGHPPVGSAVTVQSTWSVELAPCVPVTLACAAGSGKVGVAYNSALTASGGMPPYTFSIIAGSLPPGLTLNPTTGAITGTPTAAGTFSFTALVVDAMGTPAGSDTADCSIVIAASGGCTRTIGYYKTHASAIKPLPIHLGTPGGTKTLVVNNQLTGVKVLKQNVYGSSSNGITKLYAQLLAAKLNILKGADPSAVAGIIAPADAFLATSDYNDWSRLSSAQKQMVLSWHDTLDKYNNGLLGPCHCD